MGFFPLRRIIEVQPSGLEHPQPSVKPSRLSQGSARLSAAMPGDAEAHSPGDEEIEGEEGSDYRPPISILWIALSTIFVTFIIPVGLLLLPYRNRFTSLRGNQTSTASSNPLAELIDDLRGIPCNKSYATNNTWRPRYFFFPLFGCLLTCFPQQRSERAYIIGICIRKHV